ncbi:MAG: polymerase sigma-70 factor, subfamily [Actinomycetota bacterium]|nr:polymerase sigma-70 factor, subfamily [Actinomycetota bacterium]
MPEQHSRSDKELVVACQAGNDLAYAEIYRRYAGNVHHICRRMLGDTRDAEEAAQETFLRAYSAITNFSGEFQVGAWLGRIAANICLDQIRARTRRPDVVDISGQAENAVGPHRVDTRVEDRMAIRDTLDEMKPLYGEVLFLRIIGGLSHDEMAAVLELTPSQVKALLHRARRSFRDLWAVSEGASA